MNKVNKDRIIIYTTEAISGVTNGDWEEGDTLEEAQSKAISILEDMGKNPKQIKTILSLYKQTSTNAIQSMPQAQWNYFYPICADSQYKNWVSPDVWNAALKHAKLVDKNFILPEIIESEVVKSDIQIAYKTITDEEIDEILNTPSPKLIPERG